MSKHKENIKSVLALYNVLVDVIENTKNYANNDALMRSLTSQGALYGLDIDASGVHGLSINTVKRIAEQNINGGFTTLDRLRKSAVKAVNIYKERGKRSNKTTKAGLLKRVKELEIIILQSDQDKMLLSQMFVKSLSQARNYARSSSSKNVVELCAREQRELLDMVSISSQPLFPLLKVINNEKT